ncbi:MAG: cell division suppressor protein YneA [Bacillota bacterium]
MRYYRKRRSSRKNYHLMLVVLCLTIIVGGLTILFKSEAAGSTEAKYLQVVVKEGDSLWTIAKKYGPQGEDVRKIIWNLREANGLSSAIIYPGQTLSVPK